MYQGDQLTIKSTKLTFIHVKTNDHAFISPRSIILKQDWLGKQVLACFTFHPIAFDTSECRPSLSCCIHWDVASFKAKSNFPWSVAVPSTISLAMVGHPCTTQADLIFLARSLDSGAPLIRFIYKFTSYLWSRQRFLTIVWGPTSHACLLVIAVVLLVL